MAIKSRIRIKTQYRNSDGLQSYSDYDYCDCSVDQALKAVCAKFGVLNIIRVCVDAAERFSRNDLIERFSFDFPVEA